MYTQLHEIVFHGNGGFSWETVYNMPIWLRNFTYSKIADWIKKVNEDNSEPTTKNKSPIKGPDIQPNYTAKASTK